MGEAHGVFAGGIFLRLSLIFVVRVAEQAALGDPALFEVSRGEHVAWERVLMSYPTRPSPLAGYPGMLDQLSRYYFQ